jgi:predicted Zn-dependent protease
MEVCLAHFRIIALILLLALASTVSAVPTLPDLGDPSAGWLSEEQQFRMGRAWLRQLRGRTPVLADPLVQEYSENLVYRLASHSQLQEPDLAIVVINNRAINAFAVPGGVIGLNAGLYLHADQEDELASVVSHELAHVSQNHFARRYRDSQRLNRAALAAMLASVAVAIAGDAEAGMAGIAATQAAAIQSQLAYSRHHEREADRLGMQTLVDAGMDPSAMPRFFQKMLRQQQFGGDPPEFLLTHPLTEDRVADTQARAQALSQPRIHHSLDFQLIQARVRSGFFSDAGDAVNWFSERWSQGGSYPQQAAGYGLALAMIRAERYKDAEKVLDQLSERSPDQLWYDMARGEAARAAGDHDRAIAIFREVHRLMPGNYAASVMLARALLAGKEAGQARDLLDPLTLERPHDPVLWQLLADAHGYSDQPAHAHRARGEYLFLTGREEKGLEQLKYAMDESKNNFPLHSQLKARAKEMQKLIDEARSY